MNTTKAPTVTLPVTGREVPAALADYSVEGYKSMRTVNGLADTANLYRGTRKVAVVQQDGNGGATFARFHPAACARSHPAVEQIRFEEAAQGDVEGALDALMLEALALREVKKDARKYLLVVPAGAEVLEYKGLRQMPMSDALREALVAKFGEGTRYWDGSAWTAVTV